MYSPDSLKRLNRSLSRHCFKDKRRRHIYHMYYYWLGIVGNLPLCSLGLQQLYSESVVAEWMLPLKAEVVEPDIS